MKRPDSPYALNTILDGKVDSKRSALFLAMVQSVLLRNSANFLVSTRLSVSAHFLGSRCLNSRPRVASSL